MGHRSRGSSTVLFGLLALLIVGLAVVVLDAVPARADHSVWTGHNHTRSFYSPGEDRAMGYTSSSDWTDKLGAEITDWETTKTASCTGDESCRSVYTSYMYLGNEEDMYSEHCGKDWYGTTGLHTFGDHPWSGNSPCVLYGVVEGYHIHESSS